MTLLMSFRVLREECGLSLDLREDMLVVASN